MGSSSVGGGSDGGGDVGGCCGAMGCGMVGVGMVGVGMLGSGNFGVAVGVSDSPEAMGARLESHPLVGETGLFDGSFYQGFWRETIFRAPDDMNPLNATHPPGKIVQPTLTAQANASTLARFKTPESCRYGDRCRHKLSCSRYHGTVRECVCARALTFVPAADATGFGALWCPHPLAPAQDAQYHAINCACEDDRCPLGHPLRAGRDRTSAAGGAALTSFFTS